MNILRTALAAGICLGLWSAHAAAEPIDSIQTDQFNGDTIFDDVANVVRVSVNGVQYREFQLPSDIGGYNPTTTNLYEGDNNTGATPASIADAVVGNADLTTGALNIPSGTPSNVIFANPISNVSGQHEVFIFDVTANDMTTVTAITGGTAAAPVLGGSITFNTNGTSVGLDMEIDRASGGALGGPFNIGAIAVDLLGDLGETNIIGLQIASQSGATTDLSAVLATTGSGIDSLTGATTVNSGVLTNLDSVTTTERGTIAAADLVGVSVFHLSGSQATDNVLNPGAADPGGAARTSLIDGDLALNTGIINPGTNSPGTLTAGQQATLGPAGTIEGLGVTFDGGLINGPGIDLVVFEIAANGFADADGFLVNRIDGTEASLFVSQDDYSVTGANLASQLVTADTTSLNDFISGSWTPSGGATQPWVGVGIDLSDLGYSDFDVATGLLFSDAAGDGNVDFTLIAGLPSAVVPEPGTFAVWAMIGLVAAGFAVRRRRRKAA